jgi:Ca2+-binding EF-hand superfamily protein
MYDENGNGMLEYKEFAARLCGTTKVTPKYPSPQKGPSSAEEDPNAMMDLFRDKLKARGARGMIGLQRIFKIMDDDGSLSLSMPEFIKAIKDFRMGISENSVPALFDAFDTNHDGTINYDEFLRSVRGPLNDFRRQMVERAFRKIDKDGSGVLDITDIKDTYNAAKHPDVISGKKTEP